MASAKKQSTDWTEVECDPHALAWSESIGAMVPLENGYFALNCDFVRVAIADGSAPGAPRLLSTLKPGSTFSQLHYLPEWPMLVALGDRLIELIDVSNPAKPVSRTSFTYDVGHERALTFMGGELYVTHQNGVARLDARTRKPKHLFDVIKDEHFGSYPTGLTSHGEFLFVTGRHAGLQVFRRKSADAFEFVIAVRKGYTPTRLQWWKPGSVLLMVGNEDVIAVDTSNPRAVRWGKSCKVKGVELIGELARLDAKTGFVAGGKNRSRNTLVAATIDFSNPLEPQVEASIDHKDKACDFNSASFVRVGDQVFVGGTYLERLKVFRHSASGARK